MSEDDPYHDRKTYHWASKFATDGSGAVSALCYSKPHAIDLTRALWTITERQVTCPKCLRLLKTKARFEAERAP